MDCIDAIIIGSGYNALLVTIYADYSIDRMLNGHTYSRTIHILTNLTLTAIFLDEVDLTAEERAETENKLRESERSLILFAKENRTYQSLGAIFKTALHKLEDNGPTSKLRVQYFRLSTLVKLFMQADCAGDWNLKMLPFFIQLVTISTYIYLQDMMGLEQQGDFTIRRFDKFGSGLWSDLTIEQKLMRSMKSYGGLIQGRGTSNTVLAQ
jgi:hypothetical protein